MKTTLLSTICIVGILCIMVNAMQMHIAVPDALLQQQPSFLQTQTNAYLTDDDNVTDSKVQQDEARKIQGNIKLNGHVYKTVCACEDTFKSAIQCITPINMHLHQETFNNKLGLQKEVLKKLLGPPQEFSLLDIDFEGVSNIDARNPELSLGVPGGEFGQFLLALSEYEKFTDRPLDEAAVERMLADWIRSPKRFIQQPFKFFTDTTAVQHLQSWVHVNGRVGNLLDLDLARVNTDYQEAVLADLDQSANHGCYFVKALLDHSNRFYIRQNLTVHLIRAFFRLLWGSTSRNVVPSSKIQLVVFDGPRLEGDAWVNFEGSPRCEGMHRFPAFRPNNDHKSIYVNHPTVASVLHQRMASFLALRDSHLRANRFAAGMTRRSHLCMESLAEIVGQRIPFFTVALE